MPKGVFMRVNPDPQTRFWPRIDIWAAGGCWRWLGTQSVQGYGVLRVNGRQAKAHRYAYELLVGPIPAGLQLDHLCRNTLCVNPKHLEPVTPLENTRRGWRANRTHCAHGHPYDDATPICPGRGRRCLVCRRNEHAANPLRKR